MKRLRSVAAVAVFAALSCSQVAAGEFVVGAGVIDFDRELAFIEAEYHSEPWTRVFNFDISYGAVVVLDDEGDTFFGFGLSGVRRLANDWFLEASFMPGAYSSTVDFTDLGNTLNFRSQFGVGRELVPGRALSLAVSHTSNAGLGDQNPGVNTLSLRWRQSF